MKKYVKIIFSAILALSMLVSLFAFNASAATVTVNDGNYEVGQKFSVAVAYEGDAALISVLVEASYDASILRFESVSGVKADDVNATGGNIKFIDENFSGGSKKGSYRITFTAIAAGNSNVTVSATGSDGVSEFPATKTAKISVTTAKPSSNANLTSIKLSAGTLSPEFNAGTTNYNVSVKYSVESITVTGAVEDGKSTCTGNGTFDLNVGNNEVVLNVKAEDGTKKAYIINVKRMTEEETLAYEEAERNANPLLVTIGTRDYTIVNEIEDSLIPNGFTKATIMRKESEITVLNDTSGKYQLCYLVDNNGENGAFYSRDDNDNFTKLSYINVNKVMYIIEDFEIESVLPSEYKYAKFVIDGTELETITYVDEALADFYVFNCYVSGQTNYYKYDKLEGTMQRANDFAIALQNVDSSASGDAELPQNTGKFAWFTKLNATGKAVLILMVLIGVILIIAAILVIVKITSVPNDIDDEFGVDENDEFILSDFSQDDDTNNTEE